MKVYIIHKKVEKSFNNWSKILTLVISGFYNTNRVLMCLLIILVLLITEVYYTTKILKEEE